ncbi:MAG: type 1 glutamine amidotransferase [Mycobacterium sp.]
MPRQVLFLYNDPTAPEGLLGEMFTESGFDVSTFSVVPPARPDDPVLDVTFPDPLDYDVIVPLGARWAAYDEGVPWIADESAMVRRALDAGVGVLGVCFGGQLLAQALGGTVARSPEPEVGWYDVHSDDPALVPPGPWFQWHFDRLTPPPGAVEVARNARATQAFVRGRALGLQFHPEVDTALVQQWIDEDHGGDITALGMDADELTARTAELAADGARRLRLLVAGFLGLLDGPPHDAGGLR